MKTDDCRDWQDSLGAYALGHLPADERAGARGPPRGLPEPAAPRPTRWTPSRGCCRSPTRTASAPAPQPPAELGERIAATIGGERRAKRRQRRLRFGLGFGGAAAAAAAAVLAICRPARRRRRRPRAARRLRLPAERGQDRRDARTARLRHRDPHVREGHPLRHPLPRLPARPGRRRSLRRHLPLPLGRRRVRAVLSSALDLSRAEAIDRPRRRPHLRRPGRSRRSHDSNAPQEEEST